MIRVYRTLDWFLTYLEPKDVIERRRLSKSVEGLNSSLALAAEDLWPEMQGLLSGRHGR